MKLDVRLGWGCRGNANGILTSNLYQMSPCQTKEMGNTYATTKQPRAVSVVLAVGTFGFCSVHWSALPLLVRWCTIRMPAHRPTTTAKVPPGPMRYYPTRIRPLPHLKTSLSTADLSRKRPSSAVISCDRCHVQVSYLLKQPPCTSKSPHRLALG